MIKLINEFTIKLFSIPIGWRVWLCVLMFFNMVLPMVFINSLEARLTLLAFLISFVTGLILYKKQGFTRLLGFMHWSWVPLLYFLCTALGATEADHLFGMWLRGLIILNGISLILDIIDILRYLMGDRKPLNEG